MNGAAKTKSLPETAYCLGSSPWFARKCVNAELPSDIKRNMRVSQKVLHQACFICWVPA